MVQFYMSIIFIGISLIVLSLIWILVDRKKSGDYSKKLDEKKEELVKIISDSEQMIDELNKFSDYIITQISAKHEELNAAMTNLDEKIKLSGGPTIVHEPQAGPVASEEAVVVNHDKTNKPSEKSSRNVTGNVIDLQLGFDTDLGEDYQMVDVSLGKEPSKASVYTPDMVYQPKVKEKVVSIYSKHREVIRMAESGLSDSDIAKALNIGKGEIRLIVEMNSGKEKVGIR